MSGSADELARRAAEAMWSGDHATQGLGMELISVAEGFAEITMPVRQDMVNGHGICHGGFIFTLADSAFAFACNSRNQMTVAAGARIDFVNYDDATIYGRVESGAWHYKNAAHSPARRDHQDCLSALGWDQPPAATDMASSVVDEATEKRVTIGAWAPRHPHNG